MLSKPHNFISIKNNRNTTNMMNLQHLPCIRLCSMSSRNKWWNLFKWLNLFTIFRETQTALLKCPINIWEEIWKLLSKISIPPVHCSRKSNFFQDLLHSNTLSKGRLNTKVCISIFKIWGISPAPLLCSNTPT